MQLAQIDLSKTSDTTVPMPVDKKNPGVGTATRTEPSKGGTTGPVSILLEKA